MKNNGNFVGNIIFDRIQKANLTKNEIKEIACRMKAHRIEMTNNLINFLFIAAGADKCWVNLDVDLDAIDVDEIQILLADMFQDFSSREGTKKYPLIGNKQNSKFRSQYNNFWRDLAGILISDEEEIAPEKMKNSRNDPNQFVYKGYDILKLLNDQFSVLSNFSIINIRDAATEASLAIGEELLRIKIELMEKNKVNQRQLNAQSKQKQGTRKSHREVFITQESDSMATKITEIEEIVNVIFTSIFIHRTKDSHDLIRSQCIRFLSNWIVMDSESYLDDQYLKYIGWACSDRSYVVRLQAIQSLKRIFNLDNQLSKLENFVGRFLKRFIEIAACDVNEIIAFEALTMCRKLLQCGLMDNVSEDDLDHIDVLVFDSQVSSRIRQEALAFVLDHTVGFEDSNVPASFDVVDQLNDPMEQIRQRKKAALQLETLTEFIQHHYKQLFHHINEYNEDFDREFTRMIEGFVTCYLQLPNHYIMVDWTTFMALLLRDRDHEELFNSNVTVAGFENFQPSVLSQHQIMILLRILATSAKQLKREYMELNINTIPLSDPNDEEDEEEGDKSDEEYESNKKRRRSQRLKKSYDKKTISRLSNPKQQQWESFQSHLKKYLSNLLIRFKTDPFTLNSLCDLIECFDIHCGQRIIKSIIHAMGEIFSMTRNEMILMKLSSCFRQWIQIDSNIKYMIENYLKNLSDTLWNNFMNYNQKLNDLSVTLVPSNHRKNKSAISVIDITNVVDAIAWNSLRYLSLWKQIDLRRFIQQDIDEQVEVMIQICEEMRKLCTQAFGHDHTNLPIDDSHSLQLLTQLCCNGCRDIATTIILMLIWPTRDVYSTIQELSHRGRKLPTLSDNNNDSASPVKTSQETYDTGDTTTMTEAALEMVQSIRLRREKLLDLFHTWMTMIEDFNLNDNDLINKSYTYEIYRSLRREAFRNIGTIRSLYPHRELDHHIITELAYMPSASMLACMKNVFDDESNQLRQELIKSQSQSDNESMKITDQLASILINDLLKPLSNSIMIDIKTLNRRQAAAVISHLTDPHREIQELIKMILKRLKDEDFIKYLEIQMITLKNFFHDQIIEPLHTWRQAEEEWEQNESNLTKSKSLQITEMNSNYNSIISNGYNNLHQLTKQLAITIGVGKLKGDHLNAMIIFMKTAIDIAFTDENTFGFLEILNHYIRFLSSNELKLIGNYLNEKLNEYHHENETVNLMDMIHSNDISNKTRELQALIYFYYKIFPHQQKNSFHSHNYRKSINSKESITITTSDGIDDYADNEYLYDELIKNKNKKRFKSLKNETKKMNIEKKSSKKKQKIDHKQMSPVVKRSLRLRPRVNYNEDTDDEDEDEESLEGNDGDEATKVDDNDDESQLEYEGKENQENKRQSMRKDSRITASHVDPSEKPISKKPPKKMKAIHPSHEDKAKNIPTEVNRPDDEYVLGLELEDFDDNDPIPNQYSDPMNDHHSVTDHDNDDNASEIFEQLNSIKRKKYQL